MQAREIVLLLGAPGSGKGTQALWLAQQLGIPHIASGDLLRAHRQRGTDLGRRAQSAMDRGDLVPDELVTTMVLQRLAESDAIRGALLDGFPRTLPQAQALDGALLDLGGRLRTIYLEVPPAALVERLSGRRTCPACQASYHVAANPSRQANLCDRCGSALVQRADDRAEVVRNRIAVYLNETLPVVEHYAQQGVLHRVDGDRSIEAVSSDLQAIANAMVRA